MAPPWGKGPKMEMPLSMKSRRQLVVDKDPADRHDYLYMDLRLWHRLGSLRPLKRLTRILPYPCLHHIKVAFALDGDHLVAPVIPEHAPKLA